jgi:hypothetical protein
MVNGRAALLSVLVLAAWSLRAQTGRVRIQVMGADDSPIPFATVSLADSWNQIVDTQSTDSGGEILWTDVPFGNSRFYVDAQGFWGVSIAVSICDGYERKIRARLTPIPVRPAGKVVVVEAVNSQLETIEMPYCGGLDLPAESKSP